jgi:hypothetical protein
MIREFRPKLFHQIDSRGKNFRHAAILATVRINVLQSAKAQVND